MPPALTAHSADGTLLATVTARKDSPARWRHPQGEDGAGNVGVRGDVDAAVLAESVIMRINDGTRDVFAFVPTTKTRRSVPGPNDSDVDLSGPGVRWLLHAGQVLQEDTTDCAEPADTRWFGWMSAAYDDSAWSAVASHGTFTDDPWVSVRPEGWPDPTAEYIWSTTDADPGNGEVYFRRTFSTTEEQDVLVVAAADDEYTLYLDGTEILSTMGGGPLQWKRYQQRPLRICPGTHTLAIVGRNLERPLPALNYGWVMASILPVDQSGETAAQNQQWNVYHNHSSGTFTLTVGGQTTAGIAFNAAASAVQSALEALSTVGAGNVAVTGSGSVASPWVVEFQGSLANIYVGLTGSGAGLSGGTGFEIDEWQRGSAGDALVRTEAAGSWKCLAYPASVPGLAPGEILRIAVEEVQARGTTVFDHFTFGFTDTLDSAGNAWESELVVPVSLPSDVHRLAVILEELGFPIEMAPDLTLECWNERGADLSASVSLLVGTAGMTGFVCTRDEGAVANVQRAFTDAGWFEDTDTTSITARGRWESGISLDGFPDELAAARATAALLDEYATPPRTTTLEIASEAAVTPYDDFGMADVVSATAFGAAGFETTDMRVISIAGRVEELSIVWTVELVD